MIQEYTEFSLISQSCLFFLALTLVKRNAEKAIRNIITPLTANSLTETFDTDEILTFDNCTHVLTVQISENYQVSDLIEILLSSSDEPWETVSKLNEIASPENISQFYELIFEAKSNNVFKYVPNLILSIQSDLQFYNYDITRLPPPLRTESRGNRVEYLLDNKLGILAQEIKKVSEEPKRVIYTQNYFEQGTHTHTNNYANDSVIGKVSMFGRKPSANSQPNEDSSMAGLIKISGCDNLSRQGDVVFVHGLAGHAWNTWHWQNPDDKDYQRDNFWLTWLGNDLDVGIWTFGYSAARLRANGSAMPLFDQASNFLDDLENFGIGERPVVFVTHSMGGLLVKKMLNAAKTFSPNKSKEAILSSTQGIVFLSTPHLGSDVAGWVKSLAGFLTTVNVEELQAHAPQLRELDEWYRQNVDELGIQTKVYYETQPTSGVLIVTASSANPSIKDVQPIAVDANHDSIAKLHPGDSKVYLGVKKFIKECLPSENQKYLPPADNVSPLPQQMNNNINQNIQAKYAPASAQGDATVNVTNNHYHNSENPQQPL